MISPERQQQVRRMSIDGSTIKQIAKNLGVKEDTARRYIDLTMPHKKAPRVLLFDIETAPMKVLVWGLYKQRIAPDNVINDWFVISWAAKWLCGAKIMSDVVTPTEALGCDDKRIIKGIWELVDSAHIVIGQNVQQFDIRRINARFIIHGLKPPMPYQVIDTVKIARREFAFASHKLDFMNRILELPKKIHSDWNWWKKIVLDGDKDSLDKMVKYNRRDVTALEELYLMLRPWIKNHPNMGLYVDAEDKTCPACGGKKLEWRGYYYTPMNKYQAFRCKCGAIGRARESDTPPSQKGHLIRSISR